MTQKIAFELVSPEAKLIAEDVIMAVIPGSEGEFGVLSGHMPLVANVSTGVVSIYRETMNDVSERVFIAGGVADVTGEQCTVLAEQAINVNDIDKADIEQKMKDIQETLSNANDKAEISSLQKRLFVYKAVLSAV
jgi:F-type H+-transporting ATPase subunit epsilon